MKKWGLAALVAFVAMASAAVTSAASKITLIVNGKEADVDPVVIDGTTYIPVRAAAELLGAEVSYDHATKTVTITNQGSSTAESAADAMDRDQASQAATDPAEERSIQVHKGLHTYEITLPPSAYEEVDVEDSIAEAMEFGVSDVMVNEDGSVTYRMSEDVYGKLLAETADQVRETISDILAKGTYPSIKEITYDDSFTHFTIMTDQEAYQTSYYEFLYLRLYLSAMLYQQLDGVATEDVKITVDILDTATQEVLDTIVYPE